MKKWIGGSIGLLFVFTLVFSFAMAMSSSVAYAAADCCWFYKICNEEPTLVRGHITHWGCTLDGSSLCDADCDIW